MDQASIGLWIGVTDSRAWWIGQKMGSAISGQMACCYVQRSGMEEDNHASARYLCCFTFYFGIFGFFRADSISRVAEKMLV